MLLQVPELAGLGSGGKICCSKKVSLHWAESCISFCFTAANWRLAVGHRVGNARHCLSLLSRVMSVNAHGLILLG